MVDIKLGVYCAADDEVKNTLSLERMETAAKEEKAVVFRIHENISSPEGEELIRKDIEEKGLDRIVVLDRSHRTYPDFFDFGEDILVEQVPLREWVIWSHDPDEDPEDEEENHTQLLAEDYLRMACAKLGNTKPPHRIETENSISRTVLVIGGGIAGIRSALNSARAGYEVVLVEKEERLGGWSAKFKKSFPSKPPYDKLTENNINSFIEQLNNEQNIKIHLSTIIKKISGQPGEFVVTLQNGSEPEVINVGSIIQATGWRPYEAKKLGHLGYGNKNVITNIQFEEMLTDGNIVIPSNGKAPGSIAFIQCAGSRDKEHLPYCSAVCCRASLKHAMQIREQYPDTKVYILYKDIRSPGQYELFYQAAQNDPGFFFTKGEVVEVRASENDTIEIDLDETLLGEKITVCADMLVLATGMVPSTFVEDGVVESSGGEDAPDTPVEDEVPEDGKKMASGAEKGAQILNLSYRQGTDLPTLKYGFPDSHFICFPYETRRTGIFAAGTVRAPMDIAQVTNDAAGAALKAIQAIELVDKGQALHPRARDISWPEFSLQRCTQCKRCTEDCPFGALDEDDKGTPQNNIARCRRCGTCMGACPERIINFEDYSVPMGNDMIKAFEMPEEDEEKPRIMAFMCENDALPALEAAAQKRIKWSPWIRIFPVRCLGSVNLVWITNCLDAGYDGIILIGCKHGENYQCHFIRGSELAEYRMGNIQEKLKQMALEEERVQVEAVTITDWEKVPKILNDYAEEIEEIGPNPFKDF